MALRRDNLCRVFVVVVAVVVVVTADDVSVAVIVKLVLSCLVKHPVRKVCLK